MSLLVWFGKAEIYMSCLMLNGGMRFTKSLQECRSIDENRRITLNALRFYVTVYLIVHQANSCFALYFVDVFWKFSTSSIHDGILFQLKLIRRQWVLR